MLQIGKIHQLPPPLFLRVDPVKAPQQLQQPPDGLRRLRKVVHHLPGRRIEARQRVLERLECARARRLDPLLQLGILGLSDRRKGLEPPRPYRIRRIPRFAARRSLRKLKILTELRDIFFL